LDGARLIRSRNPVGPGVLVLVLVLALDRDHVGIPDAESSIIEPGVGLRY
jgi:hypothetical protein